MSFNGLSALAGVNLVFPSSGIVSIIGPNGAGKTTLIDILTGFIRPDSGSCFIGQREITHLPPEQIAVLGITRTFQHLRCITQTSALENVMLARPRQRGESLLGALFRLGVAEDEKQNREIAKRLLESVGLGHATYDRAGALSYGQQKLLSLACCLATEAQMLLLDEPIAGVSPKRREQILKLLRTLGNQGMLIIFVEHDISAVKELADQVIVMDEGKVIAQGVPSEVLARPEIMEAYIA
jgi:ABC-type branched-subunit amino acid transport system ATPase component